MELMWILGGLAILWVIFREGWGYRQRVEAYMLQQRCQLLEADLTASRQEASDLREMNRQLHGQIGTQASLWATHHQEVGQQLQGLCSQALVSASNALLSHVQPLLSHFQQTASGQLKEQSTILQHLLSPIEQSFQDMRQSIQNLEQTRVGAYEGLKEQLSHLSQGQKDLCTETNTLITALRSPHIKGCWGEMQLRRVVELAGMVPYCDFQEQPILDTDKRHGIRPDLMIHLPGEKYIFVDAKAPLLHYLEVTSAKTAVERAQKIKDHARVLVQHVKALSDKQYWAHQSNSLAFTILFLPGESFLSVALEGDPMLLEKAAQQEIILATPILLIALLKTIAHGWKQENFSRHTQRILSLSKELYEKLEKFQQAMSTLGRSLKQGSLAYQEAMNHLQDGILPAAKHLHSLEDR